MKNEILSVANLLNIELEEIFKIKFHKHKDVYKTKHYKLTEKRLMYCNNLDFET